MSVGDYQQSAAQVDEQTAEIPRPSAHSVVPRLHGWRLGVKRIVDITVSAVALLLLLPLGVVIAILTRLDSCGPVLYAQTRVGKNGVAFTMYKFRSMHKDAEALVGQLAHLNEADGPIFKIRRDPRITRVGAILRKTSLDELPQLINVLKGDMSLVGPRPPLPREVAMYSPYHRARLSVTPGITCLWQIQGRSDISFDRWVELDLEYIRSQSLWLDLKILVKTIPAVVKGTGAC